MKKTGQFLRWSLAALFFFLAIPVLACGGSDATVPTLVPTANVDLGSASSSPPATITQPEAVESAPEASNPTAITPTTDLDDLEAQMVAELRGYNYDSQRVSVEDLEIRGEELIITIRRAGAPSMSDYFGQLGAIHGIVAINEPNVARVRTLDVEGRNGFVVDMDDLMAMYDGRLDFETYRARWDFFEP